MHGEDDKESLPVLLARVAVLHQMLLNCYGSYSNLTEFIVHSQAPMGVNHGMIYRLNTFPAERQLAVLDQLAAGGFKVWYEVGQQLNVCGDGSRAPEPDKQCYNDSSTLTWLETNIKIVREHPALLGYLTLAKRCCSRDS